MELSKEQKDAIHNPAVCLQIIACAGSGKTEVLSRRLVHQLLQGAEPDNIIAFTFTEKAASELKDRIEKRYAEIKRNNDSLPPTCRGLFVGTIHSFCLNLIQQKGGRFALCDTLSQEREWALLVRVARRLGIVDLFKQIQGEESEQVAAVPAVEAFLRSLAVYHNERIPVNILRDISPAFAGAVTKYQDLLEEMRLVSFDGMISRVCDQLSADSKLREDLAKSIKYVFVDEYQDLNPAQEEILKALHSMGASITAVGDDDQAIYQWRGGDVSLFTRFRERFTGAEKCELSENRRSRACIVNVGRAVAESLPAEDRTAKSINSSRKPDGVAVEYLVAKDPDEEASQIVHRIQNLLGRGHHPGEIALLFRSVRSSARPFIEELSVNRIPYHIVGSAPAAERPETDLLTKLFVYWAGGNWYPEGDHTLRTVTQREILHLIGESGKMTQKQAAGVFAWLENIRNRISKEGLFDLTGTIYRVLNEVGIPAGDGKEAQLQEMSLGQYSQLLSEFEHAQLRSMPRNFFFGGNGKAEQSEDNEIIETWHRKTEENRFQRGSSQPEYMLRRLRSFLETFSSSVMAEVVPGSVETIDRVHVMTVHQAKGLEFPVVFVPCLVKNRFPSSLTGRQESWYIRDDLFHRERYEGRMEDEKRLFYVALSRAKNMLVLSSFDSYKNRMANPSPFLKEALASTECVGSWGSVTVDPAGEKKAEEQIIEASCTELLGYAACGFSYWLRTICGFQPAIAVELGYGRMVHHVVAELARKAILGEKVSRKDVNKILDHSYYLPFAGPLLRERLQIAIGRRINTYLSGHAEELSRTAGIEVPVTFPVEGARISGRIDLLLSSDHGSRDDLTLIDFKTSAGKSGMENNEDQLRVYAQAISRLGKNPRELYIQDLGIDHGERIPVEYDDTRAHQFKNQLEQWVSDIRNQVFDPSDQTHVCARCDYKLICRKNRAKPAL